MGLVVSCGHSSLHAMDGPLELDLLGATIDDAAGEAFDARCPKALDRTLAAMQAALELEQKAFEQQIVMAIHPHSRTDCRSRVGIGEAGDGVKPSKSPAATACVPGPCRDVPGPQPQTPV